MNVNPPKKPSATITSEPQELEHEIRLRAYELYEEGGKEDGHELDDWLRAEEEITRKKARTIAARLRTHQNRKQHTPRTHPGPFCMYGHTREQNSISLLTFQLHRTTIRSKSPPRRAVSNRSEAQHPLRRSDSHSRLVPNPSARELNVSNRSRNADRNVQDCHGCRSQLPSTRNQSGAIVPPPPASPKSSLCAAEHARRLRPHRFYFFRNLPG